MGYLQDLLKYTGDKVASMRGRPPQDMGLRGKASNMDYSDQIQGVDSQKLDSALAAADSGDVSALASMTAGMDQNDSIIPAHWQTRRNALLGLDWDIVDNSSKGKSKDALDLRKAIDNGCLRTAMQCLADVPMYGFGGCFIEWDKATNIPIKALPVHPTRFRFDLGGNAAVLIPDDNGVSIETPVEGMEDGRMVYATASRSTHPAKAGLCRPLLWIHLFISQGMKLRAEYMERFGIPFLHGKLTKEQWDNADTRNTFLTSLRKAGRIRAVTSPEASVLEVVESGSSTGSTHGDWLDDLDRTAAKLILGQTGTSGDSSGMSNGGAQTQVREAILAADARMMSETLVTQLVRPAATYLGYTDPARFEFVFDLEPPEDLAAKAAVVKTLAEAGYKADRVWISETFAIPLQVEVAPTLPVPPAEDQPKQLPLSDSHLAAPNIERIVADAAAAVASKAFASVEDMAAFYGPIRKTVGEAFKDIDTSKNGWFEEGMARLTELSSSLPESVRAMDFNAFTDALRLAQNGASAEAYTAF